MARLVPRRPDPVALSLALAERNERGNGAALGIRDRFSGRPVYGTIFGPGRNGANVGDGLTSDGGIRPYSDHSERSSTWRTVDK